MFSTSILDWNLDEEIPESGSLEKVNTSEANRRNRHENLYLA